jgi:tetratricopeptide (TPR) repeat protein
MQRDRQAEHSRVQKEKGNDAQAAMILNIVLTIARRDNSLLGTANALIGLGDVYAARGDYRRAADNYQQIMKLAESLGNKEGIAVVSVRLGNIHYYQGNFPQAFSHFALVNAAFALAEGKPMV